MFISSPKHRLRQVKSPAKQEGFTLIELLMVIGVILILTGITFGISRGVQNAQARAKAKADLAAISQGLEQFKLTMGDYPWSPGLGDSDSSININAQRLIQSLRGDLVWSYDDDGTVNGMDNTDRYQVLRFVDVDTFYTETTDDTGDTEVIIDPWGNPYVYVYERDNGDWDNAGYLLYSLGSDGASEPVDEDGILTPSLRNEDDNLDNIYLGE
jgi:prepilin-type N-terminal cleavage/methylation domain-containing protein